MFHLSFKNVSVALASLLGIAISSFLWKLAAHRRRFQDLVYSPFSPLT
jgi:hypothetical protein